MSWQNNAKRLAAGCFNELIGYLLVIKSQQISTWIMASDGFECSTELQQTSVKLILKHEGKLNLFGNNPHHKMAKPNTFVGRKFSSLRFELTRSIMSIMLGFGFLQESPDCDTATKTREITKMLQVSPFIQSGSLKPTNTRNKHVANRSTANLKSLRSWHKRR